MSVLPAGLTVTDAVSHDIVKFLQKQYESMVLRPEVSDAQLQDAYMCRCVLSLCALGPLPCLAPSLCFNYACVKECVRVMYVCETCACVRLCARRRQVPARAVGAHGAEARSERCAAAGRVHVQVGVC